MAVTLSKAYTDPNTVVGNLRMVVGTVTMDSVTSGAVAVGLNKIYGGSVTPTSWTSTLYGHQFAFNTGSGGTSINGQLRIVSATAGDDFAVVLYGEG